MSQLDISIVVPSFNEDESLPELFAWIDRVMQENNFSYEVIVVDDGSSDNSWEVIEKSGKENSSIKGVRFQRNYGKSAALNVGFQRVKGNVVITMDADLQDSPDEIPVLYKMITEDGFDLVSGWKQKRYDPLSKTIPTKLYNAATRRVSKVKLNDFNCGLKAYKLEVVKSIDVYGEMHRYIPVIAKWAGFNKIGEKVVQHQERKYGTTKFGLERFINGLLDLMSITFVSKFRVRPMHFFGSLGTVSFLIGFLITAWMIIEKGYKTWVLSVEAPRVTDQPIFFFALIALLIGVQLFLAGFLGEMISLNNPERNNYLIKNESNLN